MRGYAQKNPKQEYKREAFELFGAMIEAVKLEVIKTLTVVEIRTQEDIKPDEQAHVENVQPLHPGGADGVQAEPEYDSDVASILGVSAFYYLLRHGEATRVTSMMYLPPVFAVVLELAMFHVVPSGLTLLGMAVACAGVAMVVWTPGWKSSTSSR